MQERQNFTYVKKPSTKETTQLVWSIVFPTAVFFMSIASIYIFQNFGKILMAPMLGCMWIVGAACSIWLSSQRKEIINQTLEFVAIYCATMLAFRELIGVTSGISSEMLMATFGQPMATASANTIPGYLQTMLYISAVGIPIGYLGMEGNRILKFRRNSNKQKTMEQLRGMHNQK